MKSPVFLRICLLIVGMLIFSVGGAEDLQTSTKQHYRFNMGVFYPSIANLVTRADFKTAINLWLQEFATPLNLQPTAAYLFDNIDAMQQAFNNGELDFIMAPPILLAGHIEREKLANGFVGTSIDGSEYGIVLLARRDQHIDNFKKLSGKRLILPEKDALAEVFLDSLVIKTFNQRYKQVFDEIHTKERQSEVVLALFFDQGHVGIVNREIYHLMAEMNPQIQDSLEILSYFPAKSPNYGYFHYTFPEWLRNKITEKVNELNNQPRSQQILIDLRMARLEPCSVDELRVFDTLISEYQALKKKLKQ